VGDAKIGKPKRNGAKPDKDGGDGGHDGQHSKKVAFAH
jgi:hypothetical protein